MHTNDNGPGSAYQERAHGLNIAEKDQVAVAAGDANLDLPEAKFWPNWRDEDGLRVVGICPKCGDVHQHGLSANVVRHAFCGATYRMAVQDEPMPESLRFKIDTEPQDLAFFAEILEPYAVRMARLNKSKSHLRGRGRVCRPIFRDICEALWQSGIFAEREAMMMEDEDANFGSASRRSLVAAFILEQQEPRMRQRLAQAVRRAKAMVARGELL